MADIAHIPLETGKMIQHATSIYRSRIYAQESSGPLMSSTLLQLFDPRRNFHLQAFTGRGATGISITGIFQAPDDFAVLGFRNAYDDCKPPLMKPMPRTDLSGLKLEFDIDYDHALDGAGGAGGPNDLYKVRLLNHLRNHATVVSGGVPSFGVRITKASTLVILSGLVPVRTRCAGADSGARVAFSFSRPRRFMTVSLGLKCRSAHLPDAGTP